MKLRNRENFKSNENSMLPLVNIIFLLLIFFMIAGVIQKQKEIYEVDLGKATIDKYVEKKINTIFINLSKVIASIKDKSELMVAADKELSAFRLNQVLLVLAKQDIKKILIMTSKND